MMIARVFSPAAGVLEHGLGVPRWRAAIECLNAHLACYLAGVAFAVAGKGMRDGIFADLLAALVWLAIMEAVRRAALRQAGSSMGAQSARLGEWHLRTIFLAMLPVSLCYVQGWASGFYTASLAFLVAHLYLKACDSPPPEKGRRLAHLRV